MLDLSAAFDMVLHALLLTRLSEVGIADTALGWLTSFMEDRSQMVWLPPCASAPQSVTTGVPQGSSLSPLLFNIYVTPLIHLAEELGAKVIAYADDTQLLFTWKDDKTEISMAQHCLRTTFLWLAQAQLKCNEDKSEILLYGKFPPNFRELLWPAEFPLPCLLGTAVKNLGVWFEENLSFATHAKKLAGSCFGILKTLKKFLPRAAGELVVRALVLSRLDYANALYAGSPGYVLGKLQVVQNSAVRLLMNLPRRTSV